MLTLCRWGMAPQCRVSLCLEQKPNEGATDLYYELLYTQQEFSLAHAHACSRRVQET